MIARETVHVVPSTGPTPFDLKHGASGVTKIYRDLETVDIEIHITPATRPLTDALTLAHERGHVGVLSDILDGVAREDAADVVAQYDRWQNELEAWIRAAKGWVLVCDNASAEFVLDCLNTYRRSLNVSWADWYDMRSMLGDAIVDDNVREYWDHYIPLEPPKDASPPDCTEMSDEDAPDDWEPTPEQDKSPEDVENDGDDGEGQDPKDDPNVDPEPSGDPETGDEDGWSDDDDAYSNEGTDRYRDELDADPMRQWLDPDVIAEVLRGDPPVDVARRHGLDLASAPPLVVAHM